MEETIEILKEILYFTDVGENDRYAEAILNAINNLYDKDSSIIQESKEHIIYELGSKINDMLKEAEGEIYLKSDDFMRGYHQGCKEIRDLLSCIDGLECLNKSEEDTEE